MRQKFLERLAALAKLCGFELDQVVIALYERSMLGAGYEAATRAVEKAIMERRSRDPFPSVADLMKSAAGGLDDQDVAIEAANRIIQSITEIGRYQPKEAEIFIGPIGWYVVVRNGGWAGVCGQVTPANLSIMRAQFRDLALSAIRRNRVGQLNVAPSFEQPQIQSGRLKSLTEGTVKSIGGTREKVPNGSEER